MPSTHQVCRKQSLLLFLLSERSIERYCLEQVCPAGPGALQTAALDVTNYATSTAHLHTNQAADYQSEPATQAEDSVHSSTLWTDYIQENHTAVYAELRPA